jgi:quinol monooxygenase YgiN
VLLERSILDLFRDLVYFPYVTKIISAYIRIAATKPHPQQLQEVIKELPTEVVEASNRKGLLSLAPSFVEELVLPMQNREILPENYGRVEEEWDNGERYSQSMEQVHEETMERRVVHFLDGKLGWPTAFVLLTMTALGAAHMRPYRFRKMMLQNTTFACMLLALIALLVKARKAMRHQQRLPINGQQD